MEEMKKHWWWFERQNGSRRSPWLQSTLAALDEKTKAMLKLIDEDADSFAQRAEMYYKKRPELINFVEDFYRAHRSLAERYDLVKSESGTRLITTLGSPFFFTKYQSEKSMNVSDQQCDCYSETYDPGESAESEVEDPDQEDEGQVDEAEVGEDEISHGVENEEVMKLREEMEKLKDENEILKDQLMQKDEEKREVIRQLSLAVEVLKEENVKLRTRIAKGSPKRCNPLESKSRWGFLEKLFNGFSKAQGAVVAL